MKPPINLAQENKKLKLKDFLVQLKASTKGLSEEETQSRLAEYGFNILEKKKWRFEKPRLFLNKFKNPLIILLLGATLISAFLGEVINASLIFLVIILSFALDFYQTSKSSQAVEKLKSRVTITTAVLREGQKKEVKVSEIVPGDIIFLSAGDIIPADAYVVSAKDLFVNEAVLTGESLPVAKKSEEMFMDLNPSKEDSEMSLLFGGTTVVSGFSTALVIATGLKTT